MEGKTTYHQQVSYCGKPRCRKCQEGIGHGPYWYAYQTTNGRTTRTYIGKSLPPDIQASLEETPVVELASTADSEEFHTSFLRIFTFGRFHLERCVGQQWQTVNDTLWLHRSRVRALLALLICSPGRSLSRSLAMELLWPKKDQEGAANSLNAALYSLRKILRHPRENHPQGVLLRSEGETLVLAGQDSIWVDADAFDALVARNPVQGLTPQPLTGTISLEAIPLAALEAEESTELARVQALREALSLYNGDFLPEGQHVPWVSERSQKLRRSWLAVLLELADLYRETDAVAAIDVLNRLLAYDPANEAAVQRLLIVLARLKRRGEALRTYHQLSQVLQRDYRTPPSAETQALYEAIRLGQEHVTLPVSQQLTTPSLSTTPLAASPPAEDARPLSIGRSNQSPLVGRANELTALRSLLHEVKSEGRQQVLGQKRTSGIPLDTQRRPQCAILMGEAGIGKTRLAEEISREALRGGWSVVWSRVYVQESGVPYRLWTEALRNLRHVGSGLLPTLYERSRNDSLNNGSSPSLDSLQPLLTLLPEIADVLPSVHPSDAQFTPQQEQMRLWEAVRDLFALISEQTPLLIVLDDVQWADASSCDLLGYLARSLYGFPIFFLVTCRETELPTYPPHPLRSLVDHMLREHSIISFDIAPLSSEQIGQLVSGMSQLPDMALQYIQQHASGNPFFAEELARTPPPTMPKTVSAALEHRINRLSQPCQRLLGNISILGGSFEFPFICALEAGRSPIDEDTILTLLEEALQSGVLAEEGTGTRITYHFWHPLLVNYLYDSVSATRRARLHKRVVEVYQQTYRGREEEVAATITHHLIKGDADKARIAYYAEMAGNRAYVLSANAEAVQHYWLAVQCLGLLTREDLSDVPSFVQHSSPAQFSASDYAHHLCLLERLAECAKVRGDFEDARHLYELLLHWRELRPADEPLYEAQIRALLWGEIGRTWRYAVNSDLAWQCCERGEQVLLDAAVTSGPAWTRLRLLRCNLYLQEGRYQELHQVASEVLAAFERQLPTVSQQTPSQRSGCTTRLQRILQGDPADLGFVNRILGDIAIREARLSTALAHLSTSLAIYEQYGHKREIAHVTCNIGFIHMKRAEYELAQAAFQRAFSLATSIDDDPLISVILSDRGEMAVYLGNLPEAEHWYKRAIALLEHTKDQEYAGRWNAALATVLQELGKEGEAKQCLIRALIIGRSTHNDPCFAIALVALGNIRALQARAPHLSSQERTRKLLHARQDIQRALAISGLEAETHIQGNLAQAQVSLLLHQTSQARRELHQTIAEAHSHELVQLERQARTLLANIGGV